MSESGAFRYEKTQEELQEALSDTIGDLRQSNAVYDEGRTAEARRIAAALYMLFAHWRNQKALVRLTRVKPRLRFPDSRLYTRPRQKPGELWIGPPLCVFGPDGNYRPLCADDPDTFPRVPFSQWWKAVVFRTEAGKELTRDNLVFVLGNQDGGRHVDKVLDDEAYYHLKVQGDPHIRHSGEGYPILYANPKWFPPGSGPLSVRFRAHFNEGPRMVGTSSDWPPPEDAKPVQNGHYATIRQIGWEADQAFIAAGF